MAWSSPQYAAAEIAVEAEFQMSGECWCADCSSQGAFSDAHGYVPDNCRYKRRTAA